MLQEVASGQHEELNERRMWSRYVAKCMADGGEVEVSAPEFYRILDQMRTCERV